MTLELRRPSTADRERFAVFERDRRRPSAWEWLFARDSAPRLSTLASATERAYPIVLAVGRPRGETLALVGAWGSNARVGYAWGSVLVDPAYRRRGVGTWAIRELARHHFEEQRQTKLNGMILASDHAALAFARSLGARVEVRLGQLEHIVGLTRGECPGPDLDALSGLASARDRARPDVALRRQTATDIEWLLARRQRAEAELADHRRWPIDGDTERREWTFAPPRAPREPGSWMLDADGGPVGSVAVIHLDPATRSYWYGLWIAPEHRRRGYASAAIDRLADHMAEHFDARLAFAGVADHNLASLRLHLQLGFEIQGAVRLAGFTGGAHWHEVMFARERHSG